MALFGRSVVVEFGQEGAPGLRHSELRVGFQIHLDRAAEPSTGTIQIYNLNPTSVALLRGDRAVVRLLVGYGDSSGTPAVPRLVFQGNIVDGGLVTRKHGPDRITTIDVADGGRPYKLSVVDIVYATQVLASIVVADVVAQLGIPIRGAIVPGLDVVLTQGGVFSGAARDILDELAATTGSRWLIQDGAFYFLPLAAVIPPTGRVPLLSSANGNLIGAAAQKKDGGIEATALLDTGLRPGRSFVVESPEISGSFVATSVVVKGDSGYGPEFYSVVTGRRIGT